MQLHDEGVVHRLEDVPLSYGLLDLVLGVDVALGEYLERVVLGRSGDLAAALRVFLAGLGKRRPELGIFLGFDIAGVPVFLEFRGPSEVLALLLALDGQFLGHLHLLVVELAHVETHDVLGVPQRRGVVPLLDQVDLPERALAQPAHHLEVVDRFLGYFDDFQLFCGLIGHLALQVLRGERDLREALEAGLLVLDFEVLELAAERADCMGGGVP